MANHMLGWRLCIAGSLMAVHKWDSCNFLLVFVFPLSNHTARCFGACSIDALLQCFFGVLKERRGEHAHEIQACSAGVREVCMCVSRLIPFHRKSLSVRIRGGGLNFSHTPRGEFRVYI